MARTGNQILEQIIGAMVMRDASMTAAYEDLREKYEALKKDHDALSARPNNPPTGETKEG